MIAIFKQYKKCIKLLIKYSELNAYDFNKNTVFIIAAANGDL